jgi:hypothetical protein
MAMWRCDQCGTPQAEATRCWVCSRSAVSCSTCRQFRRSIAGRLGYCALDRSRLPLRGDEVHACWQEPITLDDPDDQGLFALRSRALAATDRPRTSGPVQPRSAARIETPPDPGWTAEPEGRRRRSFALTVGRERVPTGPAPRDRRADGRLVEAPVIAPVRGTPLLADASAELERG